MTLPLMMMTKMTKLTTLSAMTSILKPILSILMDIHVPGTLKLAMKLSVSTWTQIASLLQIYAVLVEAVLLKHSENSEILVLIGMKMLEDIIQTVLQTLSVLRAIIPQSVDLDKFVSATLLHRATMVYGTDKTQPTLDIGTSMTMMMKILATGSVEMVS
jgi:hypothetical protein